MDPNNLLLRYSEWLDTEGLMKKPKKKDQRTHEDLATEFLQDSVEQIADDPAVGTFRLWDRHFNLIATFADNRPIWVTHDYADGFRVAGLMRLSIEA